MALGTEDLFARLFLIALLSVEWAADPYYGQNPLSACFSSQPVTDNTIGVRASIVDQETSLATGVILLPPLDAPVHSGRFVVSKGERFDLPAPGINLIYVFMSLLL
jgi:hypothetical protein